MVEGVPSLVGVLDREEPPKQSTPLVHPKQSTPFNVSDWHVFAERLVLVAQSELTSVKVNCGMARNELLQLVDRRIRRQRHLDVTTINASDGERNLLRGLNCSSHDCCCMLKK